MLKKSQEEPKESKQSTNRNKLPQESNIRSLSGIKDLLAMARESRGSQIELEWTTKNPGQIYVLDVQWDNGQHEPFWSLYEQDKGQSKVLLSQFFNPNDIDMFYDILVMSCGAVDHSTKKLSEILKAQPEKIDWAKTTVNNKPATEPAPLPATVSIPTLTSTTAPVPTPVPAPNPPIPSLSPEANPNPAFTLPYGFPPGMGIPVNPAMYPIQAYNLPPNMQGVPMVYPPNINPANPNQPNQGFPAAPGSVSPGWQFLPVGNNSFTQQVVDPANQPSTGSLSALPIDAKLVNKQNDIDLLDLLIKAQLQTQPIIAATLKIQDLIRAEKVSIEKGSKILNRYYDKGEAIANHINAPIDSPNPIPSIMSKSSIKDKALSEVKAKQDDKAISAAFELLKKAGLLSSDDIKTAEGVSRKHGGDIISILQAAQKIDTNTFEAAQICQVLEKEGAMKLEQCVIVLNYCIRSRVSFDEAISELNWPNPRHLKK